MSHLYILLTLALGALDFPLSTARYRSAVSHEITDATNIFSINLMKDVFEKDTGNVIMSPLSLSTLLAMVHQAADSNTRMQLTQVLHAGPVALRRGYSNIIRNIKTSEGNSTLEFANGVFLKEGLKLQEAFRRALTKDFLSDVDFVDFTEPQRTANTINSWVQKHTHDRIKDFIKADSLHEDYRLMLLNAIYFKSFWETPFIEQFTKEEAFYKQDGVEIKVSTMRVNAPSKAGIIENLDSEWIEIPFQGKQYSMLIVLPIGKRVTFENMVKKFTAQHLTNILTNLQSAYSSDIFISLPKFRLSTEINFKPVLQRLGLTDIFSLRSNLRGITGEDLMVDQVVQKAEIEVDEKGATASAVSGIDVVPVRETPQFKVNQPFLLFIIDNNNSIPLFVGKVTDPSL